MEAIKTNQPMRVPKRQFNANDPNFVEEELQIFAKKPKINKKSQNKNVHQNRGNVSANGLEVPKTEATTSCSSSVGAEKPLLNYRQLAFLAIKNAKFIPMQSQQIWDFVEKVFPFYASGDDRAKLLWRNSLSTAIRNGKCDQGHFTSNSVSGSGLKMFYGVRKDRISYLDDQISKWRSKFTEANVSKSGVSSIEELDEICKGTKGIEFVIKDMADHVEQWKKSQLSGTNLEGYDAQERQRIQERLEQARGTNPEIDRMLQEMEEKELTKKTKNKQVCTCPVCETNLNSKSLGRHLRLIHRLTEEDMHQHKIEMSRIRITKAEKSMACLCGKRFDTSVILAAHNKLCSSRPLPVTPIQTTQNEVENVNEGDDSDEGSIDLSQYIKMEGQVREKYDDLGLL